MEPIPTLNRTAHRWSFIPLIFALGILLTISLLHGRLAALYARPAAVPVSLPRLPVEPAPPGEQRGRPSTADMRRLWRAVVHWSALV